MGCSGCPRTQHRAGHSKYLLKKEGRTEGREGGRKRGREEGKKREGRKGGRRKGGRREGGRKENKMVTIYDRGNEARGLGATRKWHTAHRKAR